MVNTAERIKIERCVLCGSEERDAKFTVNQVNLVQCKRCGFCYTDSRITLEHAKQEYRDVYTEYYAKTDLYHRLHRLIVRYLTRKRSKFLLKRLAAHKSGGRILDIGCSTGELLNIARRYGWETYGVEISQFTSNIARDKYSLNVFTGSLEEASYENAFFDAVSLFDVFSHLLDPVRDFLEINRILRDDGILVFVTGNYDLLPKNKLGEFWTSLEEDWTLLNGTSLKLLLKKTRFELIDTIRLGPITPKTWSRLGVPSKLMSRFWGFYPLMSGEEVYICKKAVQLNK